VARFQRDVLAHRPDLVVWQLAPMTSPGAVIPTTSSRTGFCRASRC
jgi:hypothetical protein